MQNSIIQSNATKSVLIVDDEQEICNVIAHGLKDSKLFKFVVTAQNGSEAIIKLGKQQFDLVILDNIMPKYSGLDVIKHVKRHVKKRPEFLIISGHLDKDVAVDFIKLGVKQIVSKPFSMEKIIDTIKIIFPEFNKI